MFGLRQERLPARVKTIFNSPFLRNTNWTLKDFTNWLSYAEIKAKVNCFYRVDRVYERKVGSSRECQIYISQYIIYLESVYTEQSVFVYNVLRR